MGYINDRYENMEKAAAMVHQSKDMIKIVTLTGNERINSTRIIEEVEAEGYRHYLSETRFYVTNRSKNEVAIDLYFRKITDEAN